MALRIVLHFKGCGPWVGMKSTLGSISSSLHVNMAAIQVLIGRELIFICMTVLWWLRVFTCAVSRCRKISYSVLVYFLNFILQCDTQYCDMFCRVVQGTNAALISPTQLTSSFFTFALGFRITRSRWMCDPYRGKSVVWHAQVRTHNLLVYSRADLHVVI